MFHGMLTTGDAAKVSRVSQQTIIRMFDSGQLKGFKVPGSRFRRIPPGALHAFLTANGIPTDLLDAFLGRPVALLYANGELATALREIFAFSHHVTCETDMVAFGMAFQGTHPKTVVVDCRTEQGESLANSIAKKIAENGLTVDLIRLKAAAGILESAAEAEEDPHIVRIRPEEEPEQIAARVAQKAAA